MTNHDEFLWLSSIPLVMIKLIKMNLFGINGVKIVIPRGFFSLYETDFGICMSVTSGMGYFLF